MTRRQKSQRANKRRKFFNSEKPHCKRCGSLLCHVTDLTGAFRGIACPLSACPK